MLRTLRKSFSILVLVCTAGASAWAETECDVQLATPPYSQAIEELAQGYISLEQMKVSDAPRASISKVSRELSAKKEALMASIGILRFNKAFDKKIKNLSRINSSNQNKNKKRRDSALNAEYRHIQPWEIYKNFKGPINTIWSNSFSPDSQLVVATSLTETADIWSTETGQRIHKLIGHTSVITHASFSHDGRYIVTASSDTTSRIWDTKTGDVLNTLNGHTESVNSAFFSPDDRYIVTAARDSVRIWDAQTGTEISKFQEDSSLSSAIYSYDGRYIITNGEGAITRVWDVTTGENVFELNGQFEHLLSKALSPDGRYLATTSLDNISLDTKLHVWDLKNGTEAHTFTTDKWIPSVSFSPDNRYIITASHTDSGFILKPALIEESE